MQVLIAILNSKNIPIQVSEKFFLLQLVQIQQKIVYLI